MSEVAEVSEVTEVIDQSNKIFWDELCGTGLAEQLGIYDFSEPSLSIFDQWYFDIYPYLAGYFDQLALAGNNVLEIGLGYGTASTYLAKKSANYFAADIAQGPVDVVNTRLGYLGRPRQATVQSCHNLNFPDAFFDNVVSIGCFHHTGSVEKCINEAFRVLKPGGKLLFMCYNKHSWRMLKKSLFTVFLNPKNPVRLLPDDAYLYDANSDAEAAPFTELASVSHYKKLCAKFSSVQIRRENWDGSLRKLFLNNIAKILGLDLYVICTK